jgi:hypothetical protein
MRLSLTPIKSDPTALALPECASCVSNAGVNAGMAGAAPCAILDRLMSYGRRPEEWAIADEGCWRCCAFEDEWFGDQPQQS